MNKFILHSVLIFAFAFLSCSKNKVDTTVTDSTKNKTENTQPDMTSGGNVNDVRITADEITIKTDDGLAISANYFYDKEKKETPQPVVILIHQFRQSKEQWRKEFIDSLLTNGFKVLAYDIRGHGESSKIEGELSGLLSDPEQAPKDIKAVARWSRSEKGIDTSRIGLIGTSIGGNLALYAQLNLGTKAAVSISNGKKTFEAFTGYDERMMRRPYFPRMKNVLLICGSKDGDHELGQKWIYDNFLEDPKEMKVFDSGAHGKGLIDEFPEVSTLILNWLKKYL
ncbi:MAG: alpha/beta hydrolase [Chlorobi bacterium]|nr:alpha/beta hydrolase [Chlorobiota bacterium]MCI0715833.1 alpha/beta hydrolase [Chlorobiota bacterium]